MQYLDLPNIAAPSNWDAGSSTYGGNVAPLATIWDGEKYIYPPQPDFWVPDAFIRPKIEASFIFRNITTVTHVYIDVAVGGSAEIPKNVQVIFPFGQGGADIPELTGIYYDNDMNEWVSVSPSLGLGRNGPPVPTVNLGTWIDPVTGIEHIRRVTEIVFPRPSAIGGFRLVDEGQYSGGVSAAIFGIYVRAAVRPASWRNYQLATEE